MIVGHRYCLKGSRRPIATEAASSHRLGLASALATHLALPVRLSAQATVAAFL